MHVEPFGSPAHDHGFHTGANGTTAKSFGHTVGFEDAVLALGGAATMAAHGGDDERRDAELPKRGDSLPDNQAYIGNTATAHSHGHGLTGA